MPEQMKKRHAASVFWPMLVQVEEHHLSERMASVRQMTDAGRICCTASEVFRWAVNTSFRIRKDESRSTTKNGGYH